MGPIKIILLISVAIHFYPFSQIKAQSQKRAMTFLDIIEMRSLGARHNGNISPDWKRFIYTLNIPSREKNKRFSDIYIKPLTGGKTRQMTFTKYKNVRLLKWHKNSSFFAFLSNRSDNKNQIFFMRPNNGEAWQVIDDQFGVSSYEWCRDEKYLVYFGGKTDEKQSGLCPVKGVMQKN